MAVITLPMPERGDLIIVRVDAAHPAYFAFFESYDGGVWRAISSDKSQQSFDLSGRFVATPWGEAYPVRALDYQQYRVGRTIRGPVVDFKPGCCFFEYYPREPLYKEGEAVLYYWARDPARPIWGLGYIEGIKLVSEGSFVYGIRDYCDKSLHVVLTGSSVLPLEGNAYLLENPQSPYRVRREARRIVFDYGYAEQI